jgi:peroxiredoxin
MIKIKMLVIAVIALIFSNLNTFSKEPGDKADDFTLTASDNKTYNLNSEINSGKIVVVIFWSTKCPFVQAYNERAKELYNQYNDKGFTFWPVNSNSTESIDEIKEHAQSNGYSFPVLKDAGNSVADMFGALRTPEVYIIGKNNVILYHGRIDDSKDASQITSHDLKNALDEIAMGKDVTVKTTKSFGCTIKKAGREN